VGGLTTSFERDQLNLPALPLGLAQVGAAAREAGHDVAFLKQGIPHLPGGTGETS